MSSFGRSERERINRYQTASSVNPQHGLSSAHFENIDVGGQASVHLGDNVEVHHHYHEEALAKDKENYDKLLESLVFDGMDARLRNVAAAFPETGTWIFDHESFLAWNDQRRLSEHNGFLWIRGKPGCGKSTIMKTILSWTRRVWPGDCVIVSYFFNARAPSNLEKSSLGLYQSVTHQLLSAMPNHRKSFLTTFSSKIRSGLVEPWSIHELQGFLVEIAQSTSRPSLCLFVDALDEGDEDDVRSMIESLEGLASHAASVNHAFRICVSSRHYPNITIGLALHLTVEHEPQHVRDIELYIGRKLRAANSQAMGDLRKQLIRRSEKIFLWVILVVPLLNKAYDRGGGLKAMSTLLDKIPKGLNALFSDLLSKEPDLFDRCEVLLRWVLFSIRALSPRELYLAILYTQDMDFDDDFQEAEEAAIDESRVHRCILDWSRGLVEIVRYDKDPTVQFIHESVRDYLLSSKEASQIAPALTSDGQGGSHEMMRIACVKYTERRQFVTPQGNEAEQAHTRAAYWENHPFASYSAHYTFHHAEQAQRHHVSQRNFLLDQMSRPRNELRAGPLEWHRLLLHCDHHSLICIIVDKNFHHLVQALVTESINIHANDFISGKTALQIACERGLVEIAKYLIEHGGGDDEDGTGRRAALLAAYQHGHGSLEIIKLLLDIGANQNTLAWSHGNLFHTALHEQNVAIAKLLLDRGADFSAQGRTAGNRETALQLAVINKDFEMVRTLLNRGADVNIQERYHDSTVLQAAIRGRGSFRQGALHGESERQGLELVQLLLDAGADVNAQGGEYANALQAACMAGQLTAARLLLDRGADVNAHGGRLHNALFAALLSRHLEIAELLLDSHADINTQVDYGETALIAFAGMDYPTTKYGFVARWLIERGADVKAYDSAGRTALCAAAKNGSLQTFQMLLDAGAAHLPNGTYDRTELRDARMAAQAGSVQWSDARMAYPEIIEILEEKLADRSSAMVCDGGGMSMFLAHSRRLTLSTAGDLQESEADGGLPGDSTMQLG